MMQRLTMRQWWSRSVQIAAWCAERVAFGATLFVAFVMVEWVAAAQLFVPGEPLVVAALAALVSVSVVVFAVVVWHSVQAFVLWLLPEPVGRHYATDSLSDA